MEHLVDLINVEFSRSGYQELVDGLWINSGATDFWLVCVLKCDYQVQELQEQLHSVYAKYFAQYSLMDKNTSLLIIQKVENVQSKTPEKVVADENDPYHFKKYIIQYTLDEWERSKVFLQDNCTLSSVLMSPEIFDVHKANGVSSSVSLLYTIAHKLPFVMLPVEQKEFQFKNNLEYKNNRQRELDRWLNSITSENLISDKIDEFLSFTLHD